MFPNLPEIYICYHLFYIGGGGGVTKNPQERRVKEIHYGVKRKQLSFWEKFRLNNSLKQKVQHYERHRKQASAVTEVTNDYNARKRVIQFLRHDLFKSFSFYKISNKRILILCIFPYQF